MQRKITRVLCGAGGVLNFSGDYFQPSVKPPKKATSYLAMYSDWVSIGRDLNVAMKKADKQLLNERT